MASLFFSYSHKDEDLRDQLEVHLSTLKRQGLLSSWHDRRILAGAEFGNAIDENLDSSDIILLLISPDFILTAGYGQGFGLQFQDLILSGNTRVTDQHSEVPLRRRFLYRNSLMRELVEISI